MTSKSKPNVLIIFPDQLRRYSQGYWSHPPYREHVIGEPDPVVTPHVDRLASEGVVFTSAISNSPVCSPHRGMLFSGRFPEQNGLVKNCHINSTASLRQDMTTLTDVMSEAGYDVGYFGKCHWVQTVAHFDAEGSYVATEEAPGGHYINHYDTYVPPGKDRHGIAYFYQTISDDHCNPLVYSNDPVVNEGKPDGVAGRPEQLSTRIEAEVLKKYLRNTHQQRDETKPFFAIWSINPPHSSWADAHTETGYRDEYYHEELYPKRMDLLVRKNLIPNAEEEVDHVRNYFSQVSSVDHYIGQVLDQLRDDGVLDHTLVVFTSDHGEYLGSHHKLGKNGPYLEAYGVPFILRWAEHLPPGIDLNMIGVPDIFPTILGLLGMEENIPDGVQGSNYASLLLHTGGSEISPSEDAPLLFAEGRSRALHTRDHLLVIHENPLQEGSPDAYLYDHDADPYQNVKIPLTDKPDVAATLLSRLAQRLMEIEDSWSEHQIRPDLLPWDKTGK